MVVLGNKLYFHKNTWCMEFFFYFSHQRCTRHGGSWSTTKQSELFDASLFASVYVQYKFYKHEIYSGIKYWMIIKLSSIDSNSCYIAESLLKCRKQESKDCFTWNVSNFGKEKYFLSTFVLLRQKNDYRTFVSLRQKMALFPS